MSQTDLTETISDNPFLNDLLTGLRQTQKSVPPRWFYDETGSELFEKITELDAYYPSRVETQILRENAAMISLHLGPEVTLVEYGAGASVKARILLSALDRPRTYIPIDISADFVKQSAAAINRDFPNLEVRPVIGDFTQDVDIDFLPGFRQGGFFPGSTIGNLDDAAIDTFFTRARALLGPEATFVLGYDLVKDPDILIRAYDDEDGVTAAFNKNLLVRANRELGADFDPEKFDHEARWNDQDQRVEMHLVSTETQTVTIGDWHIPILADESIHTENSRKFVTSAFDQRLLKTGWTVETTLTDENELFAVALMRATGDDPDCADNS